MSESREPESASVLNERGIGLTAGERYEDVRRKHQCGGHRLPVYSRR